MNRVQQEAMAEQIVRGSFCWRRLSFATLLYSKMRKMVPADFHVVSAQNACAAISLHSLAVRSLMAIAIGG